MSIILENEEPLDKVGCNTCTNVTTEFSLQCLRCPMCQHQAAKCAMKYQGMQIKLNVDINVFNTALLWDSHSPTDVFSLRTSCYTSIHQPAGFKGPFVPVVQRRRV